MFDIFQCSHKSKKKKFFLSFFLVKLHFHFFRSSLPEVFLGKSLLKICSKFTGEHPCRKAISTKLQSFIKIALRHGSSLVNLMHIFRTPFRKNTCFCFFTLPIAQNTNNVKQFSQVFVFYGKHMP